MELTKNEQVIEKLNDCLRTELAAVQTYDLARMHTSHTEVAQKLGELRGDHQFRVEQLRDRLVACGGKAVESSGAFGSFAKLVQTGADLLGDRAAVTTLEELEDWCLKAHTDALGLSDTSTREFIEMHILPAQRRTHDLCRSLLTYVKVAA